MLLSRELRRLPSFTPFPYTTLFRSPTAEDLPLLRYTEMILKESMRLYPAVWGIGRRAVADCEIGGYRVTAGDRKSTRLNSSHRTISYAVFCLKKKNNRTLPGTIEMA